MRTIIKKHELQMAMLTALGIVDKADRISKVEVDMPVGGIVTINVSFLPTPQIMVVAAEWERERLAEWKLRHGLTPKQEEILQGIERKVFGNCDEW